MKRLITLTILGLAMALTVACAGDDDDDGIIETSTEDAEETPTADVTPSATTTAPEATASETATTGPPAATEEETAQPPGGGGGADGACVDDVSDLLPTILVALEAGDAEAVFDCLSADSRQAFGPDAESFANGEFSAFQEGLGSFPNDTPVILAAVLGDDQRLEGAGRSDLAATAIAGDRMVEGTTEQNAVYASLAVLEDGDWRLDPLDDYSVTNQSPPPQGSTGQGSAQVAFDIEGIEDFGEGPGSLGEGEGLLVWLDGEAPPCGPSCVFGTLNDAATGFSFTVDVELSAGSHTFIVFFAHGDLYAVDGWSFTAE